MTREEVIEILQEEHDWCQEPSYVIKAIEKALAALRLVSREQVEKVFSGCSWCNNEGKRPENWECSLLDDRGREIGGAGRWQGHT